jgi:hypothetical protein
VIAALTGEITFTDGLRLSAHMPLSDLSPQLSRQPDTFFSLSVDRWQHGLLGSHPSEFGDFEVEVVIADEKRVEVVLLSHLHPFYERSTPEDAERRVFHEGVIHADLFDVRYHAWGQVFCRLDEKDKRDWIAIVYSRLTGVPLQEREVFQVLRQRGVPSRPGGTGR